MLAGTELDISRADFCRVEVEGDQYDSRIQGGILADGDCHLKLQLNKRS